MIIIRVCYLVTLSFRQWYLHVTFRWVLLEFRPQYRLPVVRDAGREWLKWQAILIVIIV